MRAVVLANNRIIEYLNENFINTWVSNVELGRTPNKEAFIALRHQHGFRQVDTTNPLAQAIIKGWKKHSPSDSLIISSEFELMGRQPVNELLGANQAQHYLTFLKEALDGKLPGFVEETSEPQPTGGGTLSNSGAVPIEGLKVVLTPQKPEGEILSVLRAPGVGHQDYTVINVDATAFENDGMLTIAISVGHAGTAGSFDLFDSNSELPTEGAPENALASAYSIPPDGRGTIKYYFDQGQAFKLGATGDWFSEKGSVNAFWAKISVEPAQKSEPREVSSAHLEQSAEDVMNAYVEALKNLDTETIHTMLTGHAREIFEDAEDLTEDMRTQLSQMLSSVKILSSEYMGDEFHFRLRMPGSHPPELSVKMRKVEGSWFIYDVK